MAAVLSQDRATQQLSNEIEDMVLSAFGFTRASQQQHPQHRQPSAVVRSTDLVPANRPHGQTQQPPSTGRQPPHHTADVKIAFMFLIYVAFLRFLSTHADRQGVDISVTVCVVFSSTPLGRLLRVDLITLVGLKCPSVRSYVRLSTKSFFDFNEIWYACRGLRVMHDGMQYDPIQGQGHEPLKVGNSAIFKGYFPPFIMGAGK